MNFTRMFYVTLSQSDYYKLYYKAIFLMFKLNNSKTTSSNFDFEKIHRNIEYCSENQMFL